MIGQPPGHDHAAVLGEHDAIHEVSLLIIHSRSNDILDVRDTTNGMVRQLNKPICLNQPNLKQRRHAQGAKGPAAPWNRSGFCVSDTTTISPVARTNSTQFTVQLKKPYLNELLTHHKSLHYMELLQTGEGSTGGLEALLVRL